MSKTHRFMVRVHLRRELLLSKKNWFKQAPSFSFLINQSARRPEKEPKETSENNTCIFIHSLQKQASVLKLTRTAPGLCGVSELQVRAVRPLSGRSHPGTEKAGVAMTEVSKSLG